MRFENALVWTGPWLETTIYEMNLLIYGLPAKDEVLGWAGGTGGAGGAGGAGGPELLNLGLPVLGGTAGGSPPPLVVLLLPLPSDSLSLSLNSTSGGGGGRSTSKSS